MVDAGDDKETKRSRAVLVSVKWNVTLKNYKVVQI